MKRLYITDFDGTITKTDTCDIMVEKFASPGWEESIRRWEKGELTTMESALEIFKGFQVTPDDLSRFLSFIPIDETFPDFVDYTRQNGDPLYVVSDGFDLNIRTILEKNGLKDLPVYCNTLLWDKNGWKIETPYYSPVCDKCGTCKKNIVKQLRQETGADQVIYIGDGISDTCGCQEADLIFAKKHLLSYCREHHIPVIAFERFADIKNHLLNNSQHDNIR